MYRMDCTDHPGNKKVLVCLLCNTSVCLSCVDEKHEGHKLNSYDKVAGTIIKNLLESANNPRLTKLKEDFGGLKDLCQKEKEITVKTKQELLEQRDQIKQLVDQVADTAITKLDQHNKKLSVDLDKAQQKGAKQIQNVQDFHQALSRLKATEDPVEIVEQWLTLKAPLDFELDFPKVSRLAFRHIKPTGAIGHIEHLFGELVQQDVHGFKIIPKDVLDNYNPNLTPLTSISTTELFWPVLTDASKNYNADPTPASSVCTLDLFGDGPEGAASTRPHPDASTDVSTWLQSTQTSHSLKCDVDVIYKQSFKVSPVSVVRHMQPTVEGNCWIRCFKDDREQKRIHLVDGVGNIRKQINFDTIVNGILVSPTTEHVLVCYTGQKCIKQVVEDKDGRTPTTPTLIHTGPLKPYYMCWTPKGEIVVSLSDRTDWKEEPNITSVLVKYNINGEELARAHKDQHDRNLFIFPRKVNINSTGTVAVINWTSLFKSHLVFLDTNLKLLFRNIDHGVTIPATATMPEPTDSFAIADVKFNYNNLIVVAERYSKTVKLLDPMCHELKVLVMVPESPIWSLALHANGDLWVGLQNGTVKVFNYKCEFAVDV